MEKLKLYTVTKPSSDGTFVTGDIIWLSANGEQNGTLLEPMTLKSSLARHTIQMSHDGAKRSEKQKTFLNKITNGDRQMERNKLYTVTKASSDNVIRLGDWIGLSEDDGLHNIMYMGTC